MSTQLLTMSKRPHGNKPFQAPSKKAKKEEEPSGGPRELSEGEWQLILDYEYPVSVDNPGGYEVLESKSEKNPGKLFVREKVSNKFVCFVDGMEMQGVKREYKPVAYKEDVIILLERINKLEVRLKSLETQ